MTKPRPARPPVSVCVTRPSDLCIDIALKLSSACDTQWFLLTADRHFDHPYSDRALQKKHLDQVVERRALVCDFGDLFCLMQLPFDKRGTKGKTRPEDEQPDYLDRAVMNAAAWFKPYAKHFVVMATGNHETSILKRTTSNPTDRLVFMLNREGAKIQPAGYRGYIRIKTDVFCARSSMLLYFTHGSGGSAPVTKGVLTSERRATDYPDADVIVSGHTHQNYVWPIAKHRLSPGGHEYVAKQYHVQLPSYKQALANRAGGWEHEKGFRPLATGAYWLKVTYDRSERRIRFKIEEADE